MPTSEEVKSDVLYEERRAAKRIYDGYQYYKFHHLHDEPGIIELEDAAATVSFLFEQLEAATKREEKLREELKATKKHLRDANRGAETNMKLAKNLIAKEERLLDDMAFIKRNVQRVHDKVNTLEVFYGILAHYEPLKPEALQEDKPDA